MGKNLGQRFGEKLARFLSKPVHVHGTAPAAKPHRLASVLLPGDVVLVEGNSRISTAIKYLTQSTWSHAALYVGLAPLRTGGVAEPCFIEADISDGVRCVGLSEFAELHVRICRPIGLTEADCAAVIGFARARIGDRYDLRNVADLARYLLPTPPVPRRWRRRLLTLGSGDPTRAICSSLVAQAFHAAGYPILPLVREFSADAPDCPACVHEILQARHYSFFVPRDFDVSPYFEVVKPGLPPGFDYRAIEWASEELPPG